MAAYVIAQIEVTDPEGYARYREMAPSTVERYGGRYIVRGGTVEALEGDWAPTRLVILQFESVERAKEWWNCEEYAEAKALRQRTTNSKLTVVEGL
jgi:uncharacterized protein (DUF1330 family)